MMFLALGMLWAELRLLAWVVVPAVSKDQARFNVAGLNTGWQRRERPASKTPPKNDDKQRKMPQPKP
jgi:hypothetical protein